MWDPVSHNARTQLEALVSQMRIVSGNLKNCTTTAKRCVKPWESGNGSTRSTWIWSKWRWGIEICAGGALMLAWIFDDWQSVHSLAHRVTCVLIPYKTKFSCNHLGCTYWWWERLWKASKSLHCHDCGTIGLGSPVEKLHNRVAPFGPNGTVYLAQSHVMVVPPYFAVGL